MATERLFLLQKPDNSWSQEDLDAAISLVHDLGGRYKGKENKEGYVYAIPGEVDRDIQELLHLIPWV